MAETESIIVTDESGSRHHVRSAVEDGQPVLELGLLVTAHEGRRASESWCVTLASTWGSEEVQFDPTSGRDGQVLRLVSTSAATTLDRRSRSLTMTLLPPDPGDYSVNGLWAGGSVSLRVAIDEFGGISLAGDS